MNKKIKLTESELIGVIKEIRNNIALRRRFSDGLDDNEIKDMNIQENIQRIKLMMGLIKEEGDLICKHCDERTKKNIETLSPKIKDKAIQFIDNVFTKFNKTLTVTDAFRSLEDQNKLYCQGRSKDEFCVKNKIPPTDLAALNKPNLLTICNKLFCKFVSSLKTVFMNSFIILFIIRSKSHWI